MVETRTDLVVVLVVVGNAHFLLVELARGNRREEPLQVLQLLVFGKEREVFSVSNRLAN